EQLAASRLPTILTGDFNVRRHEELIAQFMKQGFSTVQQTEPTWRRRAYVLDHIFYNAPLRPVRHMVAPTLASDHHAIVADFAFG
ncbi:MAG TPA: endonuclease/exonuclease/phosphatase family protein, partial [Opitutus sp.]|nr:endonuclease/exonuclease/phosphatase family protein [Opitutus sp.]